MSSVIVNALVSITNLVGGQDAARKYNEFTVEELQAMSLLKRLSLNDWRLELFTLSFIAGFVVLFWIGDRYNTYLVKNFLASVKGAFTNNFYQFGVSPTETYIKDSSESYSSYATGRENIAKVNIVFRLKPRHNLFVWIMETALSFFTTSVPAPSDKVEITITPANSNVYDNFIAAVVSKLGMNDFRKENYFLSLTRTSDSSNLPESFVYMSEVNEFQEKITTPDLKNALTLQAASFIRFIAFTDQPAEKPESLQELIPRRRVVFSINLTSNKKELAQVQEILEALFAIVDKLATKEISFRSEAVKKVVKTRENEIAKINKIKEDIKQEELAEQKAQQAREERDKLRSLSREEQLKVEKKAQEKKQRKLAKKQRVRM